MSVVVLSKQEKIAFNVFNWLRKQLSGVNVCTLRHISAYLAKTNDELDIKKDIRLFVSMDGMMCNILLNDGTEIRFENNSDKLLNFVVEKRDLDVFMNFFVSTYELNDLSTSRVMGYVVYNEWSYIVDLDDFENKICSIKTYYKNKLVEIGTSYFDAISDCEITLDSMDGLDYLTTIMVKLNLLFNNVRSASKNDLVRKKCV